MAGHREAAQRAGVQVRVEIIVLAAEAHVKILAPDRPVLIESVFTTDADRITNERFRLGSIISCRSDANQHVVNRHLSLGMHEGYATGDVWHERAEGIADAPANSCEPIRLERIRRVHATDRSQIDRIDIVGFRADVVEITLDAQNGLAELIIVADLATTSEAIAVGRTIGERERTSTANSAKGLVGRRHVTMCVPDVPADIETGPIIDLSDWRLGVHRSAGRQVSRVSG